MRARALGPSTLLFLACTSSETTEPAVPTTPPADCSGIRVPDEGGFRNRVALTFDDGPDELNTPAIVSTLRRYRVPAAFFFVGERIDERTSPLVREIATDPLFSIGGHGTVHRDLSSLGAAEFRDELHASFATLRSAGVEPRYFRFPFGRASCDALDVLRDEGAIATGWHVDSRDWERDDDRLAEDVVAGLRAKRGGIVLLHGDRPLTAAGLERVVTTILDAGYRFTRLDDAEVFPRLNGAHARIRRTAPPSR
jgi:peptidoglycan/xylan/chitin deacetylase (PgdA/CDA1 family)